MHRFFALIAALALLSPLTAKEPPSEQPYVAKDFSYLIGMPGFGDETLRIHFKLYQGYVKNFNEMAALIKQYAAEGKDRTPPAAELKRRLMWEWDGMRLHELYFSNLGGKGTALKKEDPLYKRIEQDFGSYDKWKADFLATGAIRGIGWVVLYLDPVSGRLVNAWIDEHAYGHMAGGDPILIMDVWEHAYFLDYGIDRGKYMDAFIDNIDWTVVSKRYPEQVAKNGQK